jgi:hypothetical protein
LNLPTVLDCYGVQLHQLTPNAIVLFSKYFWIKNPLTVSLVPTVSGDYSIFITKIRLSGLAMRNSMRVTMVVVHSKPIGRSRKSTGLNYLHVTTINGIMIG